MLDSVISSNGQRNDCGDSAGLGPVLPSALAKDPDVAIGRFRSWYRWSWVPVTAGCLLLIAALAIGWELALDWWGYRPPHPFQRALFISRALSTTLVLGAFVGLYAWRVRKHIEAVRDELRAQQASVRELRWRNEQAFGLAAMARVLAHEIRSPLHRIALHVASLEKARGAEDASPPAVLQQLTSGMRQEVDAIDRIVSEYVDYSDEPERVFQRSAVDAAALVKGALASVAAAMEAKGLKLEARVDEPAPQLAADAELLKLAVQVLLRQAVEASPQGGRLRLECRADDGAVSFSLADDGPHFEDASAVFRPFYSHVRTGESGLGLAIVRDVVRAHGGEVSAENGSGGGARIALRLPRGLQ